MILRKQVDATYKDSCPFISVFIVGLVFFVSLVGTIETEQAFRDSFDGTA